MLQNFRPDKIFAQTVVYFFTKELLGKDGPVRLKQIAFLAGYLLLLLSILLMSGITKLTVSMTLVFVFTMMTFAWVGYFSYDTKSMKLNVMMDMKLPNHLISNVLKMIERRNFEQLAHQAYDANLHCYECLIVKQP